MASTSSPFFILQWCLHLLCYSVPRTLNSPPPSQKCIIIFKCSKRKAGVSSSGHKMSPETAAVSYEIPSECQFFRPHMVECSFTLFFLKTSGKTCFFFFTPLCHLGKHGTEWGKFSPLKCCEEGMRKGIPVCLPA